MGACERVTNRCGPLRLGRKLARGQRGQAIVEFVIVFPVFLLIILGIMQISLLMTARTLVNYAAFCAARSAMVYLPGDYPGAQPAHDYTKARRKISHAAAVACIPLMPPVDAEKVGDWVSGLDSNLLSGIAQQIGPDSGAADAQAHIDTLVVNQAIDLMEGINRHGAGDIISSDEYRAFQDLQDGFFRVLTGGLTRQGDLLSRYNILDRYALARVLTSVQITDAQTGLAPGRSQNLDEAAWTCSPRQDITATVTCFYPLKIPVVDRIFYFAYLRARLLPAIDSVFEHDPDREAIKNSVSRAMDNLGRTGRLNHYLLPIRSSWTVTAEGQPPASFFEDHSGKRPGI